MNKQPVKPNTLRWQTLLAVVTALSIAFQALLVQSHVHNAGERVNGSPVINGKPHAASSLRGDVDQNTAPCLLCEEQALSGDYTCPPWLWDAGGTFAVFRGMAFALLTAISLQRHLPSPHPRGPPFSIH
ncbi:hypothetical protein [Novosphingobium beihaiensis]|uniref:hypothetical protein n=1 Tax=Novosphingobium beihaiensis TaxID=2930389 RepID=UPI001FBAC86E|nr:hypothetical protein [Novosphingobium beihaiensis]